MYGKLQRMIATFALILLIRIAVVTHGAENGRIISGKIPLHKLYVGVLLTKYPTLNNADLIDDIKNFRLAALYLPNSATVPEPERFQVWRCYEDKTELQPIKLAESEYHSLYQWAVDDKIGKAATKAAADTDPTSALAELERHLNAMPESARKNARHYAGMILAESGREEPPISQYVEEYKTYQLAETGRILRSLQDDAFPEFTALTAAGFPVDQWDLATIDPDEVKTETFGGKEYKLGFVGARLVFVPQGKSADSHPFFSGTKQNPLNGFLFRTTDDEWQDYSGKFYAGRKPREKGSREAAPE